VRVISTKPPVGDQRQMGLENARGDIVIFLDADTIVLPDFIEKSLTEMTARKLDVACPRYKPYPSSLLISAVHWFFNLIFLVAQKALPSGAGGCILTRRDFALRIGGFKKDLVYEDIEFIRRSGRRGRFGMLRCSVLVSDRRFRKFGVGRTFLKYLLLSMFFSFGLFKLAGLVSYPFGKYEQHKR
ncbi:MAG: glycosyltransferase, partial [Armatimonadetes bacterium]|nr:glycosyltransferase [Armatimonadota bacterium]